MATAVAALIGAVTSGVPLQVRAAASTDDYLEAVVARDQLARCEGILRGALGEPVKAFGAKAALPPQLKNAMERIGGVWTDQCLYAAPGAGGTLYAALWPWKSDASRITLKLGMIPGA